MQSGLNEHSLGEGMWRERCPYAKISLPQKISQIFHRKLMHYLFQKATFLLTGTYLQAFDFHAISAISSRLP